MKFNEMYDNKTHLDGAEEANYRLLLSQYLKYWPLFLLGIVLSLAGAFLYINRSEAQYVINGTLLIKDGRNVSRYSENGLVSELGMMTNTTNVDNEIIALKSHSLVQRVLAELSLTTSYYIKGWAREQEIYKKSVPFEVIIENLAPEGYEKSITITTKNNNTFLLEENGKGSVYKFGELIKKPYATFTVVASSARLPLTYNKPIIVKFHDLTTLAYEYVDKLRVNPVNKLSTVVTISLTDAVPNKGQDIINKLMEVYNKEATEDKNLIASNTIKFIDERLKGLRIELSTVEKGVEEFKRKNEVADVSSQIHQSLQDASGYNKELSEARIQLEVLESIENYITKGNNVQNQLIPSALSVADPTLAGLIVKFNELQLDRERLLRTASPTNPFVLNMNEQLAYLRNNILNNLKSTKNSLIITSRSLSAKSNQFSSRIQKVPTIERELMGINRQQEIKNSLYLYLLQKREEAGLTLAATVSNSKIVDPAIWYTKPVSPKKSAIYLIALLLGLGIPLAIIFVKHHFNNKIQLIKDVEQATSVPILGELMHNKSSNGIVVAKDSRSPLSEMFRLIRTNLQFTSNINKSSRVLLVTSSMSGEGKTFFCVNFASSLLLIGKKVVIINMDLRKQTLNSESVNGLTDYLMHIDVFVDDIVTPSKTIPDLYIINSGPLPSNPAELMMSPKIEQLLRVLRENFDFIIIDTAPVGQVADAFALAHNVDATIYIARYNYTLKSQISLMNKMCENKRLTNCMLVLNDAADNHLPKYGYGYGYKQSKSAKKSLLS
ncbi:GumC family protein [Hymenobacter radiodurans]|uniref:GumC family protein n=1 Tax=Hymenobacter radiodurans TaxID=2496028 RepID=UPI001058E2A7|nr:tyrosine-protein kinase [Hymenobacter radiodurans]